MKAPNNIVFALCASCALAACSTVTVTTAYDHSASFDKYKTYTLAPPVHSERLSALSEATLRDALRTELSARGITEAADRKADLDVVRHVFVQKRISVREYHSWGYGYHGGWPYRYGYYGFWPGAPYAYTDVNRYEQGTLILDFVDTRTKRLVFRGVGKAVVSGPDTNADNLRKAIAKMIKVFPTDGHQPELR
jgi:hypothetical protein